MIRAATADAPLQTQQGAVSLPKVQSAVDQLAAGSPAPPIKVDGSIIVDGNHRYIAGQIMGQPPAVQPWPEGTLPE
jgi:ParB-like chromosome segregation protein Spo0J